MNTILARVMHSTSIPGHFWEIEELFLHHGHPWLFQSRHVGFSGWEIWPPERSSILRKPQPKLIFMGKFTHFFLSWFIILIISTNSSIAFYLSMKYCRTVDMKLWAFFFLCNRLKLKSSKKFYSSRRITSFHYKIRKLWASSFPNKNFISTSHA